jgi:pimeloyl-ACP methyl ester carboxylesterase
MSLGFKLAHQPQSVRDSVLRNVVPMRPRIVVCLVLALVIVATAGCGGFMARRMAQAPNTYPRWAAPEARVELAYSPRLLTNFPMRKVEIGPPLAQLTYRIVDPAGYGLEVTSTNWMDRGRRHFTFFFDATVPGEPNRWSQEPRGTILLLHGHGLAHFSTVPWALRLAEEGWRCVLVNLRGHGTSTGRRVYFGTRETYDLSQLLDHLAQNDQLIAPVSVLGESYGGALALRWKAVESRVWHVVAIAPYAHLADAALNIRREYAPWVPAVCIQAGLKRLPNLLGVDPSQLDPLTVMNQDPVVALFIAGAEDRITPVGEVRRLYESAGAGSRMMVVPAATHEAVLYFLGDLVPPVLDWLSAEGPPTAVARSRPEPVHESKGIFPSGDENDRDWDATAGGVGQPRQDSTTHQD